MSEACNTSQEDPSAKDRDTNPLDPTKLWHEIAILAEAKEHQFAISKEMNTQRMEPRKRRKQMLWSSLGQKISVIVIFEMKAVH